MRTIISKINCNNLGEIRLFKDDNKYFDKNC